MTNRENTKKQYKRLCCGIEYTEGDITTENLEKFRDEVDKLMRKYKVFSVNYALNPFPLTQTNKR